jgi:hypothetical protein
VTPNVTMHEPFAAIVPPVSATVDAENVGVPPQVVAPLPTSVRFAGSVLVKATLLVATELALPSVTVTCDVAPGAIDVGLNVIAAVGPASTVNVADALLAFAGAFVDVTAPAASVAVYVPGVADVRSSAIVQLEDDGIVPFDSAIDEPLAIAVPPQLLLVFAVAATVRFDGRLSVNAAPLTAALLFGFVI